MTNVHTASVTTLVGSAAALVAIAAAVGAQDVPFLGAVAIGSALFAAGALYKKLTDESGGRASGGQIASSNG